MRGRFNIGAAKKSANRSSHKVPANIIGMNGILTFFMLFFDEKSLMNKKTASPAKAAMSPERMNPGNPDINPQNRL